MPQTLISNSKSVTLPWWVSAIVLLAALLLTAGAIIALVHPAMLVSPGAAITPATRVYADYLFSRNLALAMVDAPHFDSGSTLWAEIYLNRELVWERRVVRARVVERPFFAPPRRRATPPVEF